MDNDCIAKLIQTYLSDHPLIVLGSGASVPYGLPSMVQLGELIKKDSQLGRMIDNRDQFAADIDEIGLERAINNNEFSNTIKHRIRTIAWNSIANADIKCFRNCNFKQSMQPLVDMIGKIVEPVPNQGVIVTTNYDRLAEYACDIYGASIVTGFEGNIYRSFDGFSSRVNHKRIRARERVIKLLKVHGSVDWFISNSESNEIISIPLSERIPEGYSPLIIPPGKDKYSNTHNEPYRTVISEADKEFKNAAGFLCVGYGFNDEHLQPILIEEIKKGKPIVVITKAITPACRKLIINSSLEKYLVIESGNEDNQSKYYTMNEKGTIPRNIWALKEFLEVW